MTDLQKKLFAEMHDKTIFSKALQYGNDYIDQAKERNVFASAEAMEGLKYFQEELPHQTGEAADIIDALHQYGSPATVAQIGGRYFGFVNGSAVPSGLAAKLLATFWDQNTAMHVMSPVASALETIVEKWLVSLFGLPAVTVAGFVSGTTSANLCALAAARYRLLKNKGWDVNTQGFQQAPPIKVVTGNQAHASVLKVISILGFGSNHITFINTNDQGAIEPDLVPEMDNSTLLILNAGNVNSGAFDQFSAICKRANDAGAWVHIDGAFGLWAAASSQLSYLTQGIEYAHSWAVDGHKTLNTPYDCGIVLCADKEAMTSALHQSASYFVFSNERDGMLYTPEMSRRARIVELWATMKYLGKKGMDEMITEMHRRAKQFAAELSVIKGFSILNEVVFNQVLVACDTEELTNSVLRFIQKDRICWVGGSMWHGKRVIRISVCSWATTANDVTLSVRSFQSSLIKAMAV